MSPLPMQGPSLLPAFAERPYNTESTPVLYLIGMPIGNPDDISLRALRILKGTELVICESRKVFARYCKAWGLDFPRDSYIEWNEHNDPSEAVQICDLILRTKSSVLLSDAGMPVLADPGSELLRTAREMGMGVEVIPGPTALTAALALAGLGNRGFRFAGFPPRKMAERRAWLSEVLRNLSEPVVIYETPYRLHKLIDELCDLARRHRSRDGAFQIFVAANLTQPKQYVWQGPLTALRQIRRDIPKAPPVLVLYREI